MLQSSPPTSIQQGQVDLQSETQAFPYGSSVAQWCPTIGTTMAGLRCFDLFVHYKTMTSVKLINIPITSHTYYFTSVVRTLGIYYLRC